MQAKAGQAGRCAHCLCVTCRIVLPYLCSAPPVWVKST